MNRNFKKVLTGIIVLAMVLSAVAVLPQNSSVKAAESEPHMKGYVRDIDDNGIANVDVVLRNVHTQEVFRTNSSADGNFSFSQQNTDGNRLVPPGYYKINAYPDEDYYYDNTTTDIIRYNGEEIVFVGTITIHKMPDRTLTFSGSVMDGDVANVVQVNDEVVIESSTGETEAYLDHKNIYKVDNITADGKDMINGVAVPGISEGANILASLPITLAAGQVEQNGTAAVPSYSKGQPISADIPIMITAGVNDVVNVSVDGGAEKTLTLKPYTYFSGDDLAEALDKELTNRSLLADCYWVTNRLVFQTREKGDTHSINVIAHYTGTGGVSTLGFNPPVAEVAGVNATSGTSTSVTVGFSLAITADTNDKMSVSINGDAPKTITVAPATYNNLATLLGALNQSFEDVGLYARAEAASPTQVSIVSNVPGSDSTVVVTQYEDNNGYMDMGFSSSNSFDINVDGDGARSVYIAPGAYSGVNLAAAINNAMWSMNPVVEANCTFDTDHLNFTSNSTGPASSVQITRTDTNSTGYKVLGFENPTETVGINGFAVDYNTGHVVFEHPIPNGEMVKANYSYYAEINGATVKLINNTYEQEVINVTTDSLGNFSIEIWPGDFTLTVSYTGYNRSVNKSLSISTNVTYYTIMMSDSYILRGTAKSVNNEDLYEVRAYLFNSITGDLLIADVEGTVFWFDAYPGDFTLMVDAQGQNANVTQVTINAGEVDKNLGYVNLERGETQKQFDNTTVDFINGNWSQVNMSREWTLNADSKIPGLGNENMGNARAQIDLALGNSDGILQAGELTAFENWLHDNGPKYVVTKDFFRVSDEDLDVYYISDSVPSDYHINVTDENGTNAPIDATEGFTIKSWINYTATEVLSDDAESYNLRLNATYDEEVDEFIDYSYTINLLQAPKQYEMVSNSTDSHDDEITVSGYKVVTIDPDYSPKDEGGDAKYTQSWVSMQAKELDVPQPRVKIEEYKAGDGSVYNSSEDANYTVYIIKKDINVTIDVTDSFDTETFIKKYEFDFNGDGVYNAADAWDFDEDGNTETWTTNETFTYKFTTAGIINLKVRATDTSEGKNETNVTVQVDEADPTPVIDADKPITDGLMEVDEGEEIMFNGSASNDTITVAGGEPGIINKWVWDFGDGNTSTVTKSSAKHEVNHTYNDPGDYDVTLNVTDIVGHWAVTNITVHVNDTTAPSPRWVMMSEDWTVITEVEEGTTVYFNASSTADNFDDAYNLTYEWDFGDGNTSSGMNVSHTYAWGIIETYNVTLKVKDTSDNEGEDTQFVRIAIGERPDIALSDMLFVMDDPESEPTEGKVMTIAVNMTNWGKTNATGVNVVFYIIKDDGGERVEEAIEGEVKFYNSFGDENETTGDIPVNETISAQIKWTPDKKGNYTIKAVGKCPDEHDTFTDDNVVQDSVEVKEAAWRKPLIYGIIIAVIIVLPLSAWLITRRRAMKTEVKKKKKKR